MARVSMKDLEAVAQMINNMLGVEHTEAWSRQPDGSYKANVGYYHVSSCTGSKSLVRLCNESGGITDILRASTSGELMGKMRAFMYGIEAGRANQ